MASVEICQSLLDKTYFLANSPNFGCANFRHLVYIHVTYPQAYLRMCLEGIKLDVLIRTDQDTFIIFIRLFVHLYIQL